MARYVGTMKLVDTFGKELYWGGENRRLEIHGSEYRCYERDQLVKTVCMVSPVRVETDALCIPGVM